MSPLLEWIDVTSNLQKVTLVGLVVIMVGIGFWVLLAEPILQETAVLDLELQELDRKLAGYIQSETQFHDRKEMLSKWTSLVSQQKEKLGLEVSMNQILSDMSALAQQAGIILTLWKPDEPDRSTLKPWIPRHLQLQMEGGYHQVARFLDQTQYLPKALGVTALKMQHVETTQGTSLLRTTIAFIGYEGGVQNSQNLANNLASIETERQG